MIRRKLRVMLFMLFCFQLLSAAQLNPLANTFSSITKNDFVVNPVYDDGGASLKGINFGLNFVRLQSAVAAIPDVWIERTRWSEIWLENFRIDYREKAGADRLVFGGTLRYQSFTKNIFRPSERWRTLSLTTKLQGSIAVVYNPATGNLDLKNFRVDLIDLRNFPGWIENWLKKEINTELKASMPLNVRASGLASGDVALRSIRRSGDFLFFDTVFNRPIPSAQIASVFAGDYSSLLRGVRPRISRLEQRVISLSRDIKYTGDNQFFLADGFEYYGLDVEFDRLPGTTGLQIEYSADGRSWRQSVYPNVEHDAYQRFILGDYVMGLSRKNLPPAQPVFIRAAYRMQDGTLGAFFTASIPVDDYRLGAPLIRKTEVFSEPASGSAARIQLDGGVYRGPGGDRTIEIQLSRDEGRTWLTADRYGASSDDAGSPGAVFSLEEEGDGAYIIRGSSPYGYRIGMGRIGGPTNSVSINGNWETFSLPPGSMLIRARYRIQTNAMLNTAATGFAQMKYSQQAEYGPWSSPQRIVVADAEASPPIIAGVDRVAQGQQDGLVVRFGVPPVADVEIEYRHENMIGWQSYLRLNERTWRHQFGYIDNLPWNYFIMPVGAARQVTLNPGRIAPNQSWRIRARYITGENSRSAWSKEIRYAAREAATQPMAETKYPDGAIQSRVPLVNGMPHGMKEVFSPTGKLIARVPYVSGQLHGTEVSMHESGRPASQTAWVQGRRHGIAQSFYPDGRPASIVNWTNGMRNGPAQEFHADGKPKFRGTFLNDRPVGVHEYFYPEGRPERIERWDARGRSGPEEHYYPNGRIKYRAQYVNDQLQGPAQHYNESGAPAYVRNYSNGKMTSEQLFWPNGKQKMTAGYFDDRLNGTVVHFNEAGQPIRRFIYSKGQLVREEPVTPGVSWRQIGELVNSGGGDRRTAGKGGNAMPLPLSMLKPGMKIRFEVVGGSLQYYSFNIVSQQLVTESAGGLGQRTVVRENAQLVHRGNQPEISADLLLSARSRAEVLYLNVNGERNLFDPLPCRIRVLVSP